jgi:hypothetical protein
LAASLWRGGQRTPELFPKIKAKWNGFFNEKKIGNIFL